MTLCIKFIIHLILKLALFDLSQATTGISNVICRCLFYVFNNLSWWEVVVVGHHCLNILFTSVALPYFLYGLQPYRSWSILIFYIVSTVFLLTICISYITTAREEKESSQDLPVIIGSVAGSTLAFIVIGIVSIYIWRRQLA